VFERMPLLPLPASGKTLQRWRMLAEVAALDLSLAKLFESHADAAAILVERGSTPPLAGTLWGTWCAEPPDARLVVTGSDPVRLNGLKSWCSGAALVSHAVVSCWDEEGQPCLARVMLNQAGVRVTQEGWHAVGMAGTASVDVRFDDAIAERVGAPHAYTRRPGFWQGGAGIAACWWGGAQALAVACRSQMAARPDAHGLAHLGAIDVALRSAAALLREAAQWIDAHPRADAQALALRTRLGVETAALEVLQRAARTLGPGPLCRDASLARRFADLPVFMRQSHAERDLQALGEHITSHKETTWRL